MINIEIVNRELEKVSSLLEISNKRVKKLESIENRPIQIIVNNGVSQYYDLDENGKRRYIHSNEIQSLKPVLQKNYELKVNQKLKKQKKALEKFIKGYEISNAKEVYESYCEGRKRMVEPLFESDEDFLMRWFVEHPGEQNNKFEQGNFKTIKGEHVKSKSEKIIADTLFNNDIPYVYEPSVILGKTEYFPDFMVLNMKTRKTIYWEHFGIISDEIYARKNFAKLYTYEKYGIEVGKDLIITMEGEGLSFDMNLLEEKIRMLL